MRARSGRRALAVVCAATIAAIATGATLGATAAQAEGARTNGGPKSAATPKNAEPAGEAESAGPELPEVVRSSSIGPGLSWIVLQLVPSPELVSAHGTGHFGARWQVTPMLYSFGVHRGEPRLRSFLVEPIVRHSGSLEFFVSPEYLAITNRGADRWFIRPGLRAYFPLIERGDYLSCSIGTSYAIAPTPNVSGVGYEIGVYSFFGVLGAQITYAPARLPVDWIATLSFRYF